MGELSEFQTRTRLFPFVTRQASTIHEKDIRITIEIEVEEHDAAHDRLDHVSLSRATVVVTECETPRLRDFVESNLGEGRSSHHQ